MHGHASEGDRQQLARMRATGLANGLAHGKTGVGDETPLRRAASGWLRQGYRVEFDDEHLVQLAAPFRALSSRDLLVAALFGVGLGAVGTCATLGYLWLTRRHRWHIVSLMLTPERQVVTHEQWQSAPTSP